MICFKASYGNVLWQECKADSSWYDKDATIRILRMVTCFFKVMSWTWSIDAWIDAWKSPCSDETTTSPEVASNSQSNAIHRVIGLSSLWKNLLKKMQDTKIRWILDIQQAAWGWNGILDWTSIRENCKNHYQPDILDTYFLLWVLES